jgi:hypothetical protein
MHELEIRIGNCGFHPVRRPEQAPRSSVMNGRPGNSVNPQGLKHLFFRALNVTAEAVTYKDYLRDGF